MATALIAVPGRMWGSYNRSMIEKPLATKAATCAVGFAIGDGIAQLSTSTETTFVRKAKSIDVLRNLRMSLYGLIIAAPMMHVFFTWLDKAIMPNTPKHPVAIISKVALDQLINSPVGTCVFFAWNNALNGTPQNIVPDIQEKLWSTTLVGWRLWPAAQAVNMLLVPSHLRIAYINIVAIFWTNILSRMASSSPTPTRGPRLSKVYEPILESMHLYDVIESRAFKRVVTSLDPAKHFVHDAAEALAEQLKLDTTVPEGLVDPLAAFPYLGPVDEPTPAPKRRRRRRFLLF